MQGLFLPYSLGVHSAPKENREVDQTCSMPYSAPHQSTELAWHPWKGMLHFLEECSSRHGPSVHWSHGKNSPHWVGMHSSAPSEAMHICAIPIRRFCLKGATQHFVKKTLYLSLVLFGLRFEVEVWCQLESGMKRASLALSTGGLIYLSHCL